MKNWLKRWLGWINFWILQWFCVRLAYSLLYSETSVRARNTPGPIPVRWMLMGFVRPMSGWEGICPNYKPRPPRVLWRF